VSKTIRIAPSILAADFASLGAAIQTVENGSMTKDLAILIGPSTKYLNTNEFLDLLTNNLSKKLN